MGSFTLFNPVTVFSNFGNNFRPNLHIRDKSVSILRDLCRVFRVNLHIRGKMWVIYTF